MKSLIVAGALATCVTPGSAIAAPYQAQVLFGQFSCEGAWCKAPFPVVPSGKTLTVTNASCIFTAGGFVDAQLEFPVGSKTYYQGLALEWQRANGASTNGTFGKDNLRITVAAGKRVTAVTQVTGNLVGAHCELFGDLD